MPQPRFPPWLHDLSILSLAIALACAAIIAVDEVRHRQSMWIMALVWPLTALFGGVLWLAFYWRWGRAQHRDAPMAVAVAKGASHCGAGCVLGDIIAEGSAFAFPGLAVAFGWKSLFDQKMFAVWILDFIIAFGLGIGFQYFAIAPMRNLSVRDGVVAALKADAASITAWQVGMYGAMAGLQFLWFRPAYGGMAEAGGPEFWFAMQIAMMVGFGTAYPVNWLLVKVGLKEKM